MQLEIMLKVSMDNFVFVFEYPTGGFFQNDESSNKIGFIPYKNGEKIELSGTVTGQILTPAGKAITCEGTLEDGNPYIILPAEALKDPGIITIMVKVNGYTIGAIRTTVYPST